MNFNFDLFIDIIWLSGLCGIISTLFERRLKSISSPSKYLFVTLPVVIGLLISLLFTNLSIELCLVVGLTTWLESSIIIDKFKKIKH